MSDNNKTVTAREAALSVLAKVKQVLETSSLAKSEYKTENSPTPGVKYGKIETAQKAVERDYNEYEVKSGSSKDSTGPRIAKQTPPTDNKKEQAEGNNKPDGMEPRYEFKDKVKKELAKQNMGKAEHQPHPGATSKVPAYAAAKQAESEAHLRSPKGDAERKAANATRLKLGKAENPDKEADAALGEKVEGDVEQHFKENAGAERQEGHSMVNPEDKTEKATMIPRLILSAKLSKFMEHMHSKRKNAQAQAPAAVGSPATDAPAPRSTEDGRPEQKKI